MNQTNVNPIIIYHGLSVFYVGLKNTSGESISCILTRLGGGRGGEGSQRSYHVHRRRTISLRGPNKVMLAGDVASLYRSSMPILLPALGWINWLVGQKIDYKDA